MTFDLSAHDPGEPAHLWSPHPVSDERQMVTDDLKLEDPQTKKCRTYFWE